MCVVWIIKFKNSITRFLHLPKEINKFRDRTFKRESYLHLRWLDYFPIVPADYPDSTVDWDRDSVICAAFDSNCHYCSDNNCSTMTTNWMPTDVGMVHWVRASHPLILMKVRPDTVDMEAVFVEQQLQQPDDNTYRPQMVPQADLGQGMAKNRYTVDHRRVFEMQHNCPPRPATPSPRQFVASIWFCNEINGKIIKLLTARSSLMCFLNGVPLNFHWNEGKLCSYEITYINKT